MGGNGCRGARQLANLNAVFDTPSEWSGSSGIHVDLRSLKPGVLESQTIRVSKKAEDACLYTHFLLVSVGFSKKQISK